MTRNLALTLKLILVVMVAVCAILAAALVSTLSAAGAPDPASVPTTYGPPGPAGGIP